MKIGIYGGSFNPIHYGHIETAKYLINEGIVDNIGMVLNPCSSFKRNVKMPDAYHRAVMMQKAIDENNCCSIQVDITEMINSIHNNGVCYTVDTLKEILYRNIYSYYGREPDEFYLIIGTDVFNNIKKFKHWHWFLEEKLVKLIILPRGGYTIDEDLKKEFSEIILEWDSSNFVPCTVSSTFIRDSIKSGNIDNIGGISCSVRDYIKEHKLYGYTGDDEDKKEKIIEKYIIEAEERIIETKKLLEENEI